MTGPSRTQDANMCHILRLITTRLLKTSAVTKAYIFLLDYFLLS